ncbi:pyrimidine reductase family protein [uncultured Arthrobacter sp.]|uniref:pyrimidine reductase family protein n=1 Tax=uncultured Arthrobacter sp. TaxID=114050 RepID=UPI0026338959|nr:pyrimidine reductase family protein [uncultured Arthrobacter sp.]
MINQLLPDSAADRTDDDLLALYGYPSQRPWVRFNFISSLDGSATHQGVSAPLGNAGDRRLFGLIRRLCDVILVGAGTVRAEGYAGPLVSDEDIRWRTAHGLAAHPALGIISGTLGVDPDSDLFRLSPVRPILFTTTAADQERVESLSAVSDVVIAGVESVGASTCAAWLNDRGLGRILCEGGPSVFDGFLAEGAVDELCLSLSPLLTGGQGSRIAAGVDSPDLRDMVLASLLESDSALYGRWVRAQGP